jgi:protein phosphatase PTC6
LQENLHKTFESVDPKTVPDVVAAIKAYGGYFRRFRGGALQPWAQTGWDADDHTEMNLTLEAYATLAFLQVSITPRSLFHVLKMCKADIDIGELPESSDCGATASVAIIHSLDIPETPFYSANWLSITVAHCG